ncbi:5-formyltetrahydrofolate cyclo-ligase [Xylariomycetidae sp. FL0641]|nr:5-formyltetrahydrofolate cyclo-ligase [Xylariomycetidae sp. FL0641]
MPEEPEMNSAALHAAKSQLRSAMKQKLASISRESIESQSAKVFDSLSNFQPYADAKNVGVYLAMPGRELQTDRIVRHALGAGKRVFVPYLHKSGLPPGEGPARLMDMVSLRDAQDYEALQRDKWGIPSVDAATVNERQRSVGELDGPRSQDARLDLILMPGVAFDIDPNTGMIRRLGHGKGFYDYFLHRYALATSAEKIPDGARSSVLLYALALKEQFLPPDAQQTVPVGPHDQPIDGIFLGDGSFKEYERRDGGDV